MAVDSFATTWVFISVWAVAAATVDFSRVVFIINSQPNSHHAAVAEDTATRIRASMAASGVEEPHHVYSAAHEDFLPLHGAWTYFPLIEAVARELADVADWFVFLEESTDVNLDELSGILSSHSPDDDVFVGHALADLDSVIQHHYAPPGEVKFPQTDAGFVLSRAVVERVREEFESMTKSQSSKFPKDFSIDPAYELARMLGHLFNGDGVRAVTIKNDTRLCLDVDAGCAVHPREKPECKLEEIADLASSTLFAVKTCKKFHEERLTVVGETWANAALNVKFFSEEADPKYGTIVLPGVRNTERGHCGKTLAIIKYFNNHASEEGWKWLVIADDDTILSVKRYVEMLACYDPSENIALGQRYGFRIASGRFGYDYPTGGGGMVFSAPLVKKIVDSGHCECTRDDAPDDMHLGSCLTHLGVSLTHSPRFHQARPEDYHPKVLQVQKPVSFHKFWNTDPRKIYRKWFYDSDTELAALKASRALHSHTEL